MFCFFFFFFFFDVYFIYFFFFFFQAEDGIRDPLVTGVQTCALPISAARGAGDEVRPRREDLRHRDEARAAEADPGRGAGPGSLCVQGGPMKFEWPLALAAFALLPAAAFAYLAIERRRSRFALKFTNLEVLASVLPARESRRRFVPPGLFLVALAVALFGLARPEVARTVHRQEATVVLTVDTSGSMVANDVQPTRLGAAQQAVRTFVG